MKRNLETTASQDLANSTTPFPGMSVAAPAAVANTLARRASNDASEETPVRALDAMAICMASSTFGG